MAICREFHKPDLFITMTCNPRWREIEDELLPGQTAQDRPDVVARVFKLKMESFLDAVLKVQIYGEVSGHMAVVEWQKRGLPHLHLLLILRNCLCLCLTLQNRKLLMGYTSHSLRWRKNAEFQING
jgi:hypothetical protein